MQFTSVFVSLLLASSAAAKNSTSVKSQCSEVAKLTKVIDTASNDTKLATKFDNNQTLIDAYKTKAADDQTKLTTLTANATLMADCAVISAHEAAVDSCSKIAKYESEVALAANTTKLSSKLDGNATKIAAYQAKAATAATKLASLSSNTTLTAVCANIATVAQCDTMSKLQKEIAKANTTLTARKSNSKAANATASAEKVAKLQAKLDALTTNTTLVDTCNSLTEASTTSNAAASTSSDSTTTTAASAAGRVQIAGNLLTGAALAIGAAMLML
ncbi:hypothetical protein BX600DRAFT_443377 [Xylariales sp. PMI_506]|nr:hypothetical protein BX600DRAFT_443377 [Xylariales sp. PMI_506]